MASDNPEKKVRKPKVKKKETLKSLPAIPETVDPEIQALIKDAFIQFYDTVSIENSKNRSIDQLNNITTEFLKAFITIGYDLNGDKVFIMHASNAKDRDALLENLRFTMFNIFNQLNGNESDEDMDQME